MGAWAITSPANYAVNAGWVGMVAYSLSCGAPIIILSFLGDRVSRIWPDASSLADFVGRRFGPVAKGCVVGVALFNMCLGLLGELTAIGALFKDFVGAEALPIM
jgi:Na+/proline symporter